MENTIAEKKTTVVDAAITPAALLNHWQGHRRLTRKMIESFPEKELFNYSVGGMRPFSELVLEMLSMAAPGIRGAVTNDWKPFNDKEQKPATKAELLRLWDETTDILNEFWPKITPQRFQETTVAFGQYEGSVYWVILYFIDNEIHHRGQGYVYLRSLGITPPPFWER